MDLNILCFTLFGVLFTGFLVLEGFDYGVGMLLPFFGKTDMERQAIINTLAPVWEGNEMWLIAAGAFLFASFPNAYATLFSSLYLALLLILVSLIARGVAFEFRDKETSKTWRSFWDWSVFVGSLIPSLLWGVATASLLKGLPINSEMQYSGTLGDLLSLYTLLGGLVFVILFLVHGVAYLNLKLEPYLADRVREAGLRLCKYALIVSTGFGILTYAVTDVGTKPIAGVMLLVVALALFLTRWHLRHRSYAKGFIWITVAIISVILAIFIGLFPRIIVSSLDPRWSLDIYNAASNPLTLKIMIITMLVVLPVIVTFQCWKYYVFRQRISTVEIELNSHGRTLAQMNQRLRVLVKYAYGLADTMNSVIRDLRNDDSDVINGLNLKHKTLVCRKKSRKLVRKDKK